MLSEALVARVSASLAMLTCVLLYLEARSAPRISRRWIDRALVGIALCSAATFVHWFSIPVRGFYHRWEMFHYVMGAKYAPELGYERLYTCTLLADAENGHRAEVEPLRIRDLRNDAVVEARDVLRDPAQCQRVFRPERWRAWKGDVAFFRRLSGDPQHWAAMQLDHGYNPSPVWTALGRTLVSVQPLSTSFIRGLAWIDPLLMAASILVLGWGFGPRTASIATIFWSTQAPASFAWTGGAFLRQDWLLLAVLALVALRKQRPALAGFCLGWCAWLRVFPALLWLGPLVLMAVGVWRTRALSQPQQRMLVGGACATLLLVPLGWLVSGGGAVYLDFARHLSMHAGTPILNHMSLRSLMTFALDARVEHTLQPDALDPMAHWTALHRVLLHERAAYYALAALGLMALFMRCVARLRTPWLALGLSIFPIMLLTDPSSYYYSFVVLVAPLARARRSLESLLIGLAAASQLLMLDLRFVDDRFVALSALYVVFGAVLVLGFSRKLGSKLALSPSSAAAVQGDANQESP